MPKRFFINILQKEFWYCWKWFWISKKCHFTYLILFQVLSINWHEVINLFHFAFFGRVMHISKSVLLPSFALSFFHFSLLHLFIFPTSSHSFCKSTFLSGLYFYYRRCWALTHVWPITPVSLPFRVSMESPFVFHFIGN